MVEIGEDAPDFELLDGNRNTVTGNEHKGRKVILAFYPGSFTGVCTKEMCTFQDSLGQLNDANATVLGICVDSPFSNAAFAKANDLSFPILSDHTRSTVQEYGVALENFAGMQGFTAAQRSVFIVDENGDVAWKWVADVPSEEPDYDAIIEFVS